MVSRNTNLGGRKYQQPLPLKQQVRTSKNTNLGSRSFKRINKGYLFVYFYSIKTI